MKKEVEYAIQKLDSAFLKLEEGTISVKDELDKDGVIQRFEFTFELFWKALKIFLEYNGIEVKTPRDSLKESFRINLFKDDEVFLDMLEDRNRTSHIYDRETAEEIFERIKTVYIHSIKTVLNKLKKYNK